MNDMAEMEYVFEDEKILKGNCQVCGSEDKTYIDKYEDEMNIAMFSARCKVCKKERFFNTRYYR